MGWVVRLVYTAPPTPTRNPPSAASLRFALAAPLAPGFALRARAAAGSIWRIGGWGSGWWCAAWAAAGVWG